MTSSDNDFYSDDSVADTHNSLKKKKFSSIIAVLLLLVGGTYLVQTTLAANISLNTGSPIEFGQGITATEYVKQSSPNPSVLDSKAVPK